MFNLTIYLGAESMSLLGAATLWKKNLKLSLSPKGQSLLYFYIITKILLLVNIYSWDKSFQSFYY